jgi:hypothetical protein
MHSLFAEQGRDPNLYHLTCIEAVGLMPSALVTQIIKLSKQRDGKLEIYSARILSI